MQTYKELHALLPWYVNGTLDVAARRALEQEIAQSLALRNEVAWLQLVRSQIREQTQTDVQQRSESVGLDTLMALVHGEQSGKVLPLPSRITRWMEGARRFPLSMGIAAAVVLTQAVIIGALLDQPAPDPLRTLSGSTAAGGQLLQITFKPLATETQIRTLLSSVRGEIVGGPGALGVYAVRVPERQGAVALEKLRNDSSTVDSVALLPSR
nr:hypothetical protein [Rhodoferax sp.]